ncbi:hypothetical protein [Thermomonospora catenispora]|uniref:hypothetical protein n=1 Tax=Thermomonospora catenispora TaxID=2493090 RepID=UPI0019D628E6|nr:hypothetical protein [Thermomonospora catenispora]
MNDMDGKHAMPSARFFFDAGSGGILWGATPEDSEEWGYPIDLSLLPISQSLRAELEHLVAWYDTSLNRDYPPDPGPWGEEERARFDEAVRRALERLRAELGPSWEIRDEFEGPHEDPDLDRRLADSSGRMRTDPDE